MSGGLILAVIGGLAVAAVGAWLLRRSREPLALPERPARVEQTSAHGKQLIIERWIFLALELCRVDGAIDETEIVALEHALQDPTIGLAPEEAAQTVHNALRATIREASIVIAADEIAREADDAHRDWVVRALESVAAADGRVNRDEKVFLQRVKQALGVA